LVCTAEAGHTGDHEFAHDAGRATWPEGWGVVVGLCAAGKLADPNVKPIEEPTERP
jgi:hypothetical protein